MPYIKQEDRNRLHTREMLELSAEIKTPGELNYVITKLCHFYAVNKGESYATYNEVIGVLECAKLEYYRRPVAIYEDKKILENGDI